VALTPGTRLGPYEVISLLGSGGMGEVYKARDTRLGRSVAVKIIAEGWVTHPDARARFEMEAVAISKLDHPHICSLFDIGHDAGTDYLVMPLLDGQSLEERLSKGPLPLREAMRYALQIADALDKAHRAGVVHRDLKPGNVMLTRDGVKLLDFGLSHSLAAAAEPTTERDRGSSATTRRLVVGTPRYMAPEQVAGRAVDRRTDLFAFGELIYETITGVRAFRTDPAGTIVFDREPAAMATVVPEVPAALARAVAKCLLIDPDDRWQTARDLLDELKWIDASWNELQAVDRTRVKPRQTALALIVVAVAAAAAIGGYAIRRTPDRLTVRFAVRPPPGAIIGDFAAGPDGRQVVYVQQLAGTPTLWVRSIDAAEARPLADTNDAHDPFWSPDGATIAFFADGKLKRIPAAGGPVQTVCDAPAARGGSWGAGGLIVFAPNIVGPLLKVAAAGGTPSPATSLDRSRQEDSHRKPHFLPDGRRFLFIARSHKAEWTGVDVAAVDSGERGRVLDVEAAAAYVPSGHLLYLRDGTQGALMALPFDVDRARATGTAFPADDRLTADLTAFSIAAGLLAYTPATPSHFVWFDRAGKASSSVTPPGRYGGIALSPDGTRAAVRRVFQGNADLWLSDLERGTTSRITSDPAADDDPVWAPDAHQLAFSSTRQNTSNIYLTDTSGAASEHVMWKSDLSTAPADWSSDGRTLLFVQHDPKTLSDIWALPLEGDRKPFVVLRTEFTESQPRLSPDGRWMAYESNESGRWEVFLRGFPQSGDKRQISIAGGAQPQWRRNGGELFYVDAHGVLLSVTVHANGNVVDVGTPTPLFQTRLEDYAMSARYAPSPDGQRFLINVQLEETLNDPLNIAAGWRVTRAK
jgi:Tol biopolymer transport system component